MPEQYEVSVTIGVRQLRSGQANFSASETFTLEATGFAELMDILVIVHDLAGQLHARGNVPQSHKGK